VTVSVIVIAVGQPLGVVVGPGRHLPLAAVPNPQYLLFGTEVLVVVVDELVEVGGAGLQFPFKAVPKPQNGLTLPLLLLIAVVLVALDVVLVALDVVLVALDVVLVALDVVLAEVIVLVVVVFDQWRDEVDVEMTELVVVVVGGAMHDPLAAVPNPHQ